MVAVPAWRDQYLRHAEAFADGPFEPAGYAARVTQVVDQLRDPSVGIQTDAVTTPNGMRPSPTWSPNKPRDGPLWTNSWATRDLPAELGDPSNAYGRTPLVLERVS